MQITFLPESLYPQTHSYLFHTYLTVLSSMCQAFYSAFTQPHLLPADHYGCLSVHFSGLIKCILWSAFMQHSVNRKVFNMGKAETRFLNLILLKSLDLSFSVFKMGPKTITYLFHKYFVQCLIMLDILLKNNAQNAESSHC